jgi:hypothetical protein
MPCCRSKPARTPAIAFWILVTVLPSTSPLFAQPVVAGAYYFDGWTGESYHLTPRLREEFANREPVWGWRDDSLPVVEEQIACAADHGLAFFAFDWYWPEGPNKQSPLNTGLQLYLQATNRDRLQFCLMVANHGGYQIGPADWDAVSDIWVRLFRQPTQLRLRASRC